MPDVYVINTGNGPLEIIPSFADLILRNTIVLPPGAQAHFVTPDQETHGAVLAHLDTYGVQHAAAPAPGAPIVEAVRPVAKAGSAASKPPPPPKKK